MKAFILQIKTVLTLLFIGLSLSLSAINSHSSNSYFDHLSEINAEWQYHKEVAPKGTISFDSDLDRIQLHLNLAIQHLQTNIPANFNSDQISNRLNLLEKLQDYADKKVFPINKYHSVRTPYFVDHLGTNCAVGQMIYVSGHEDLVAKISKEHNYDYIRNIRTEGLVEWANEFGFTVDELKWIQPGYNPPQTIDQIKKGANGTVKKVIRNQFDEGLLIVGDFTELDSLPCMGIGTYRNNHLSCLGNGIEGKINDVLVYPTRVFVVGEFMHNGQIYPVAKYDGNWTYIEIPNRIGAIGSVVYKGEYEHYLEVVISHDNAPHQQEIWHLFNDNTWEKQAGVNGFIADITSQGFNRVYGGHFDTVFLNDEFTNTQYAVAVNNLVIRNYDNLWFGIGANVSDTVKVVEYYNQVLYIGGTCSSNPAENDICISRYYNSVLQPLFLNIFGQDDFSINTLAYKQYSNEIIFGGRFRFTGGMTNGENIASYNLVMNWAVPIGILDKPVHSFDYLGDDLYIGGEFQSSQGQAINHLGRISSTLSTNEYSPEKNINVYPNPFASTLNLEGIKDGTEYSILHIDGRMAKNGTVMNERIDELDFLPKGSYLLRVEMKEGDVVKRVLK